jgi:predicted acetylornithine/succinylornithine family transaminase
LCRGLASLAGKDSVISAHTTNVVPTYARFDLALSHGEGSYVWDYDGKKYLDMAGGIAVNCLGHSHPAIVAAVEKQAKKLMHISNLYYNEEQGKLAQRIVEKMGPGKVFFCNSGAEANEGLFKLARLKGNDEGKYGIITALDSFHGRTLAGISATGQDKIKAGFGPCMPDFSHVPFNDLAALEAVLDETHHIAVHIEGIQGESGIQPATAEYLIGLRKLCDERGLLLSMDAVQCGHFRTGEYQSYTAILKEAGLGDDDFTPDCLSMAKSLGGGFPMGAFWVRDKYADLLGHGKHGTTFGGNPLGCAVGNAIFDVVEAEGLQAHAAALGERIKSRLAIVASRNDGLIKEVRGFGCMLGIELVDRPDIYGDGAASGVLCGHLHDRGLLAVGAGMQTVRFLPPFNLSFEEADSAVDIFESALQHAASASGR